MALDLPEGFSIDGVIHPGFEKVLTKEAIAFVAHLQRRFNPRYRIHTERYIGVGGAALRFGKEFEHGLHMLRILSPKHGGALVVLQIIIPIGKA